MAEHSMAADGFFGKRGVHRRASVSKVDNGFVIKARIPVVREKEAIGGPRLIDDVEDREFVFYTVEEVLSFMDGYLSGKMEPVKS